MPVAAMKVFGFDTPQWSQLNAVMGLMGFLLLFAILMFSMHGHPEKVLEEPSTDLHRHARR